MCFRTDRELEVSAHLELVRDEQSPDERLIAEDACEALTALAASRPRNDEIRRGALSMLVLLALELQADPLTLVAGLLG